MQATKLYNSQRKTGVNLFDLGLGIDFREMTLKVPAIKEKPNKLDFIKI